MDMTRESMEYIAEMAKPNTADIEGITYCDKQMHQLKKNMLAAPIAISTLQGVVTYITKNLDGIKESPIILVKSPTEVSVMYPLNSDRDRECVVNAAAIIPDFPFGRFVESEEFVIAMQSRFIPDGDYAAIMSFAGTAEAGTVQQYSDDGVSQKATVKTGISQKADAIVPNPVSLRPYRTFTEVEQPLSKFIFRMDNKRSDGITCALFEADGKAWRKEAMDHIKAYLDDQLKDVPGVTVIA